MWKTHPYNNFTQRWFLYLKRLLFDLTIIWFAQNFFHRMLGKWGLCSSLRLKFNFQCIPITFLLNIPKWYFKDKSLSIIKKNLRYRGTFSLLVLFFFHSYYYIEILCMFIGKSKMSSLILLPFMLFLFTEWWHR